MTKEEILDWLDKNNRGFTQKDFELFKKFHEEATKELKAQIEQLTFMHNEDINTIKLLNEQIEKMKAELHHRLVSPSHSDSDCLDKIIGLDRLWQFGQEF